MEEEQQQPEAFRGDSAPSSKADVFELLTGESPTNKYTPDDPRVSLRPVAASKAANSTGEPTTLSAFREREGSSQRLSRLQRLFESIKPPSSQSTSTAPEASTSSKLDETKDEQEERKRREENRKVYARELWGKCTIGCESATAAGQGGETGKLVRWNQFEKYADEKERELWNVFKDFDIDGDMKLRIADVREACSRAGFQVNETTLEGFMQEVDKNKDGYITFGEWRDFLLVRFLCFLYWCQGLTIPNSCCLGRRACLKSSRTTKRIGRSGRQCLI